jgi:threonine dehydratase
MISHSVALSDVENAARHLAGRIRRTPLIPFDPLAARLGVPVWLKCENLQLGGAFKVRGATHAALAALQRGQKVSRIVTYSSGNHGQGCAIAARSLGLPCTVVMPCDAPAVKVEGTRLLGAEVRFEGHTSEQRRVAAEAVAQESGYLLIRPFDDADVVAGQGTVGLEILGDCGEVDTVVVPCGGGGLAAGVTLALTANKPSVRVASAEPDAAPKLARSILAGQIVSNPPGPSIADGLRPNAPGAIPFGILRERLSQTAVVSDDEIERAVAWLFRAARLVVEPSGAASVAALMAGKIAAPRGPVVAVISGGNVDPAVFGRILSRTDLW